MNPKPLLFFSSDATELYKADVFRVLALPDGHTIQFRYERKYVLPALRDTPENLKKREGVVYFLAGNDRKKDPALRVLEPYPLRKVVVRDAFLDDNTDQLILILELKEFTNCQIGPLLSEAERPPQSFVTEAELIDVRSSHWIDRVRAVEAHFPEVLFYRLGQILRDGSAVKPTYSPERRLSYFELEEESEYAVECSCYDRTGGRLPLEIRRDAEEIDFSNTFESGTRATLDTQRLPLTTKTLKSRSAPAFMTFYSPTRQDDPGPFKDPNHVRIGWRLTRSWWKPLVFGAFTALAASGLVISQTSLKTPYGTDLPLPDIAIRIVGVILIGIAGAQLFKLFNKT